MTVSAERSKVVDFTLPTYETYLTVMMVTKSKSRFLVMQPLQYRVWLAYAGMAVVAATAICVFERKSHSTQNCFPFHKSCYLRSAMWMIFRVIVNQGT